MKCSIIQDLLPIYCDDLTSNDSREEIEKHLAECETCREVYENMKTKEINITVPDKDIRPLKKVNKRNRFKIVGVALAAVVFWFGVFIFVFWGIVPIKSEKAHYTIDAHEEVRTSYQSNEDESETDEKKSTVKSLRLDFTTESNSCRFNNIIEDYNGKNGMHEHLYIYPKLRLPFDDDSNSFEIGFDVREGDTLTIHYRDKEETIDLYQLYTENVKE
ncbi:MAG: zf-HC2 domain-containing protein [Oscillospiraceae bacterium]|nr:zf-HC2 domain-containing protein [Oscillospiraceae bacterium]